MKFLVQDTLYPLSTKKQKIIMRTLCPVFDGHNDTFLKLYQKGLPLSRIVSPDCPTQISLSKAQNGGMAGGLFAICVPFSNNGERTRENRFQPVDFESAEPITRSLMKEIDLLVKAFPDELKLIRNSDDLQRAMDKKQLAIIIHFEGAEAIAPDLRNLDMYYQLGLRSLGIMWSRPNAFGNGVKIKFPGSPDNGEGLTGNGIQLVKRCNELGIMLDVSHMNQKEFYDVVNHSQQPVVASHSGVHHICPSSRNLTDAQLKEIGRSKGLVGVNFEVKYLRPDGERNFDTELEVLIEHLKYIADIIGVEHVAIGSDFDGANIPNVIKDASGLRHFADALTTAGFNSVEIQNILSENWLRVLKQVWK